VRLVGGRWRSSCQSSRPLASSTRPSTTATATVRNRVASPASTPCTPTLISSAVTAAESAAAVAHSCQFCTVRLALRRGKSKLGACRWAMFQPTNIPSVEPCQEGAAPGGCGTLGPEDTALRSRDRSKGINQPTALEGGQFVKGVAHRHLGGVGRRCQQPSC